MENSKIIFFNIGWMSRYEGHDGKPDKIVGGGGYINEHGTGHEVCNFAEADDGNVYGHVETIKGETDRKIQAIDHIGGKYKDLAEGVTVVWTATDPEKGRGHVVGWYTNAKVYRERKPHDRSPSKQHPRDDIKSYIAVAKAENAFCLPIEQRTLKLPQSVHPGRTAWRVFPDDPNAEQQETLSLLKALMASASVTSSSERTRKKRGSSGGTAITSYQKYVAAYEVTINPTHSLLQSDFCKYLQEHHSDISQDIEHVDATTQ